MNDNKKGYITSTVIIRNNNKGHNKYSRYQHKLHGNMFNKAF